MYAEYFATDYATNEIIRVDSSSAAGRNVRKFSRYSQQLLRLMFSSVYLARSLGSDKFSCTTWPFNLVEFALIFVLSAQNGAGVLAVQPILEMVN